MEDSQSVFERIARGDESALKECMDRYGGLVWSLARKWSETAADAEDASQEIFLELWKCADRFDRTAGTEPAFVTTIARRRLIEYVTDYRARGDSTMAVYDDRAMLGIRSSHASSTSANSK